MAKTIELKVKVDSSQSITSLKDLRKAYKAAMDEAASGSEEATERAGQLKDEIINLNESVNQLAAGTNLEKFGNVLGGVGGKLKSLDFKGASENAAKLAGISKAITFKEVTGGLGDLGKAFLSFGKALLTNPFVLLAAVIIGIVVALVSLRDKVKFVSDIFAFFGDIIDTVVQALKDFADWIGLTNFATEDAAAKTIEAAQKTGAATTKRYEDEIALAEAAGKRTFELEQDKQKAIIQSASVQIKALESVYRANGMLSEEQTKQLEELVGTIKEAQLQIKINAIKNEKEKNDEVEKVNKEASDKAKAKRDKEAAQLLSDTNKFLADVKKIRDAEELRLAESDQERLLIIKSRQAEELKAQFEKSEKTIANEIALDAVLLGLESKYNADVAKLNEQQDKEAKEKADEVAAKQLEDANNANIAKAELAVAQNQTSLNARIALLTAERDVELTNAQLTADEKALIEQNYVNGVEALKKDSAERIKKKEEEDRAAQLAGAQNLTNSLQGLSDAFFAVKKMNLEKGSAAERKAAEKQFKINKALAIVSATIQGVQAVLAAYTSGSAIPIVGAVTGPLFAALAAVTVGLNIAKIAKSKFNPDGGGGGDSAPATGGGGAGIGAAAASPAAPTLSSSGGSSSATISSAIQNKEQTTKVVVVESDITNSQQKVAQIQETSRLG